MTLSNLTLGQRKGLFTMLRDQQSPMTNSERKIFDQLVIEFRNVKCEFLAEIVTFEGSKFFRCGRFVKQVSMDTFGDVYRNCWIKIQESSKGEFITSTYIGGGRIYLD